MNTPTPTPTLIHLPIYVITTPAPASEMYSRLQLQYKILPTRILHRYHLIDEMTSLSIQKLTTAAADIPPIAV